MKPITENTNYGAKVFLKLDDRYHFVLSIPISTDMDSFIKSPDIKHFIGFNRVLATIPELLSSRHENALLPVELAHSIASLSTYPSAQVLKLFADATMKTKWGASGTSIRL